jgi:two-component system, NtrC family, sensor histidine kinase HydH
MSDDGAESRRRLLEERYAELAAVASGLAHEIKNPLSTLNLNLQLLAEDFQSAENQKERRALEKIGRLQQVVERLEGLLNDFLRFARVERLNLKPTALKDLVEEIVDFYGPQAAAKNIVLRSDVNDGLPMASLDRDLFKQALFNLLLNAQHAMPNGGDLILRGRTRDGRVLLSIIDTGVGIKPEAKEKIFEPFFSTRSGGSGLGLPTAKRIVDAHDGKLSVESVLGQGTAFTIDLPAAAP